jgi:hypothetical protein
MHTALPLQFTTALTLLKSAYSALIAGSRTIPLGDNGAVIKELAASTGRQATRAETRDPFRKA